MITFDLLRFLLWFCLSVHRASKCCSGASELDDIVSRKESTHCTLPAQFCHLTVCTKHFGQSVPSGFIVPDALLLGARCSQVDENVTEKMYRAMLQVLTASATHASEH
eukprot:gnl/TRDRNA2_/TRDRNA2_172633_c0_seq9.p1 gnl/TRDRNA2_/TRDRNA2_172633_c0~~gnl/TRDRNA2_/TRDRNA2_172633_c0_seq9.p1  ORF type:complete len:108 (+),score=7.66 gnl/TRDRNA2_/TRDRNA2_172633_c0_seq9:2-325(+)